MRAKRPAWGERGYDPQWLAAAAAFKNENPWCVGCMAIGVRRFADVVDHIVPHKGDEVLFWADGNWQSSCAWHHNAIKPMLERMWMRKLIPDVGLKLDSKWAVKLTKERHRPAVGEDGLPIDGT